AVTLLQGLGGLAEAGPRSGAVGSREPVGAGVIGNFGFPNHASLIGAFLQQPHNPVRECAQFFWNLLIVLIVWFHRGGTSPIAASWACTVSARLFRRCISRTSPPASGCTLRARLLNPASKARLTSGSSSRGKRMTGPAGGV